MTMLMPPQVSRVVGIHTQTEDRTLASVSFI